MTLTSTRLQEPTSAGPRARGRRRDATRDDALRQAALDLLVEVGYDRMTIDAVAARAQAGKGTVYRRWANKAELVADALAQRHAAKPVPDTGSLRRDLEILLTEAGDGSEEYRTRLFTGLVPALAQSQELRAAFGRVRSSSSLRLVIERAVERGEITAPHDPDLVAALFPALSVYRFMLFGELNDPDFARAFVTEVLMPLLLHPNAQSARGN